MERFVIINMEKPFNLSNKIDSLESIRGLAALSVVLWHYYELFSLNTTQDNSTTNSFFFKFLEKIHFENAYLRGSFSVTLFFILSGFVLSYSYMKKPKALSLVSSSIRRIPRLAIPCIGSLLICLFLYKTNLWLPYNPLLSNQNVSSDRLILDGQFNHSLFYFIKYCFRILIDSNATINRSLWTISWEISGSFFVFYFLFIAFSVKNRFNLYIIFTIFFILTMNYKMMSFMLGILLCDLFVNNKSQIHNFYYFLLASFGWIFSNYFYNILENISILKIQSINSLYPIFLGCCIIYGSIKSNFINFVLQFQPLVYIGKISFSMYLLHLPVFSSFSCITLQFLLGKNLDFPIANDITFFLSLILLFAISHFFFLYVDQLAIKISRWIQSMFMPLIENQQ